MIAPMHASTGFVPDDGEEAVWGIPFRPESATTKVRTVHRNSVVTRSNATTGVEENSPAISTLLLREIETSLRIADGITFEDGMDNAFRQLVIESIRKHGSPWVDLVARLIMSQQVAPAIAAELLHNFGSIDHPTSYLSRLSAMLGGLRHPSVRVRDGAVLGLSLLDDPNAIPMLTVAARKEPVKELRRDMVRLLAQLKESS